MPGQVEAAVPVGLGGQVTAMGLVALAALAVLGVMVRLEGLVARVEKVAKVPLAALEVKVAWRG